MSTLVGSGIVTWQASERVTNRYGAICLQNSNYHETVQFDATWYVDNLKTFDQKHVRITAVVREARDSGHLGDMFLGIRPSTPEVGEEVDCGVGTLVVTKDWDGERSMVLLQPSDGRQELWIDPRKLYRLHDQTVDLYVEETTDEDTPEAELELNGTGTEDLGDGSFQIKKVKIEDVRNPPVIEKLGDGLFVLEHKSIKGRRF
jgi:hypothetical protein